MRFFLPAWEEISYNTWILSQLREGLEIAFHSFPPARFLVTDLPEKLRKSALVLEVENVIKKVLVPVRRTEEGEGFHSSLFLSKKPDGSFRTIINVKPLNKFIIQQKFKWKL